jgi:hypothetical protein
VCDACKDEYGVLSMLRIRDDLPDAVTKAAKRLRCYYECVTRGEDIFNDEDEPDELLPGDDLELDDDDELGLPRY